MADSGVIQREEEEQKGVMERQRGKKWREEAEGLMGGGGERLLPAEPGAANGQLVALGEQFRGPYSFQGAARMGDLTSREVGSHCVPPLPRRCCSGGVTEDVGRWKEPEPEPAEPTLEDAAALVNTWRGEGGGAMATGSSGRPAAIDKPAHRLLY